MSAETLTRFTCDRCDFAAEIPTEFGRRQFLPEGWAHIQVKANDSEEGHRYPFNWLVCSVCYGELRKALRNGK